MYNCVNVYARLDFYEAGPAGRESQLVFNRRKDFMLREGGTLKA